MIVLVLLEAVVLVALCVLVAGLLRAYGTVLRRLHQLDGSHDHGSAEPTPDFSLLPVVTTTPDAPPAGIRARSSEFGSAHDIAGETVDGEIVSARLVDVAHDTLVLFLSSGCSSCETFWDELSRPGSVSLPVGTRLLVVPQSAADESLADLVALAPSGVDVVLSSQAWRDYEVPGSPHAVYVDGVTGGIRGEGTGQSLAQVTTLLARSAGNDAPRSSGRGHKPDRDAEQELAVDRELLAAGILPGDPSLYASVEHASSHD